MKSNVTPIKKSRQVQRAHNKQFVKLKQHIEKLGAAFCKETDLLPHQTCLRVDTVQTEDGTPAGMKYWYEKNELKKIDDLREPELKEMFHLLLSVQKGFDGKEDLSQVIEFIRDFTSRYEKNDDDQTSST